MMKLPLADVWIIANYPVFRAALVAPFGRMEVRSAIKSLLMLIS